MWEKIDSYNFFAYDFGIEKSVIFIGFLCLVPFIILYAIYRCKEEQKKIESYEENIDDKNNS